MDYAIGFVLGILVAALIGFLAVYLLLRDKTPPALPLVSLPAPGSAAVTILVSEQFINQQLQQLFISDAGGAPNAPVIPQTFGPVTIKPNGAQIDFLPERHARLSIRLTATALGITINLRPVAEFVLMPQSGRIRILVTRILLEGVNIPRQWVESFINAYVAGAEQQLNHFFRQLQDETHVNLADIETSGDVLILKFS